MTVIGSRAHGPAALGRLLPIIFLIAIAAAYLTDTAFGQEFKSGHAPGTITTQPLGVSGWRSDPIVVTSQQLGMTGWRSDPIVATTQPLGMSGWRDDPVKATTPALGMTGWRSEPIRMTASVLGMTGWRRQPDAAAPARLVCLGGQVVKLAGGPGASGYSCACPQGRRPQAAGSGYQNTFQCVPDLVVSPPPKVVCIGGTVRAGRCTCAAGKTPKITEYAISGNNMTAWRCEDVTPSSVKQKPTRVTPQLVCAGGSVRNDSCVCPTGSAPVKTGATSFRCQRVEILPPLGVPKSVGPTRVAPPTRGPSEPKIACAGGVVRSNICVCPGGTSLQNGTCRPVSSAPLRSRAVPQRVR